VILVDTNVIVALANRSDIEDERCRRWPEEQTDELALPITVLDP
jgi:predicted nucleic acid-binding protein